MRSNLELITNVIQMYNEEQKSKMYSVYFLISL